MRIGLSTSLGAENAQDWAEKLASLGCKSVVFPLNFEAPDALVDEYVREAKAHDLQIAEVGIWRNALSFDPQEELDNLKYSIGQLALADRIGASCCVNVAGSAGPRWDGGYRDNFSQEMWIKTVQMAQKVIDEVQPKNTFFTLEPMPWMIPTGPQEYLGLIEDVGRDAFAVHMDIINMINCPERYFFHREFLDETFELLGDKIKSCHLKDITLLDGFTFQLKECACGEGDFDLEHYVDLANAIDPDMPMIIEHLENDEAYIGNLSYVQKRLRLTW